MPRQNFLAKESFVNASEKLTKEFILCIPVFASNIKLVSENQKLHSFRFLYHHHQNMQYHIDVSVLPLNDEYTRISLHGMHIDAHAFEHDANLAIALHDFESAAGAAINGDSSLYKPYEPKTKGSKKMIQFVATTVASVGILFLKKKLS
jgi:hypothetical protein